MNRRNRNERFALGSNFTQLIGPSTLLAWTGSRISLADLIEFWPQLFSQATSAIDRVDLTLWCTLPGYEERSSKPRHKPRHITGDMRQYPMDWSSWSLFRKAKRDNKVHDRSQLFFFSTTPIFISLSMKFARTLRLNNGTNLHYWSA